jgi:hypothetical protein
MNYFTVHWVSWQRFAYTGRCFFVSKKKRRRKQMKKLTACNKDVQVYMDRTDLPLVTKDAILESFAQSVLASGQSFERLFPSKKKQRAALDQIAYLISHGNGICKVESKTLAKAKKVKCSVETVLEAVKKIKKFDEILVAGLADCNNKYIFVFKSHPNFQDILKRVFFIDELPKDKEPDNDLLDDKEPISEETTILEEHSEPITELITEPITELTTERITEPNSSESLAAVSANSDFHALNYINSFNSLKDIKDIKNDHLNNVSEPSTSSFNKTVKFFKMVPKELNTMFARLFENLDELYTRACWATKNFVKEFKINVSKEDKIALATSSVHSLMAYKKSGKNNEELNKLTYAIMYKKLTDKFVPKENTEPRIVHNKKEIRTETLPNWWDKHEKEWDDWEEKKRQEAEKKEPLTEERKAEIWAEVMALQGGN